MNKFMTQQELDAIRMREQAATPGPWKIAEFYEGHKYAADVLANNTTVFVSACKTAHDAEFIAHARQDISALLDEVMRLQEALTIETARADGEKCMRRIELLGMIEIQRQVEADRDRWKIAYEGSCEDAIRRSREKQVYDYFPRGVL